MTHIERCVAALYGPISKPPRLEDTAFGTRMRQELLRGLMLGAAVLTVLVVIVLTAVVLLTDLPVTVIVLIYLALVIAACLQP